MELVTRAVLPNNICKGCLSCDRILEIITNDEVKQTYCTIIHEKLHVPGPLVLCWECIANIQRYISFRRQCAQAHDALLKYMVAPTNITSLSKLAIVKNSIEIKVSDTYEDTQRDGFDLIQKKHNSLIEVNLTRVSKKSQLEDYDVDDLTKKYERTEKYKVDSTQTHIESQCNGSFANEELSKDANSSPTDKRQREIQFIKIEDDATLGDVEGYFVNDEFDHQDDIDDKNFNVELEPSYKEKNKVKSKRNKRKTLENDFNDSDEEPLKNKKSKKTEKKRKHRRKIDSAASKRKKQPAGRREKPAGVVSNPRVNKKLKQLNIGEGQVEMVVLSWEEVEEERQKALSSIVFTRHEYRCHDCIVGFNHKFKLENHMKKHDPSSGEMVCSVCKVRCRDSHALCAHRRRHRVRWRCCSCGETSSRAAVAADHVTRVHHAPPPTHTCSVCGHEEPTLGKLRNHIKNHSERQKCELCGKTFRDRTSLRTHLFIHKGEKEYSCPRCDKKFLFKKAMEVHLVTHDAPAHLYCYQCDMNFKNRMSYTQHMKYSLKHIDPAKLKHACPLCDKKFSKAARLREHTLGVHLKATPVRCHLPACTFACSSRPVLRTHIRMVHRNARAQRNHVCDACGKTYTTKKTLEGHLRSHTGERPFACPLCPSTFGYEAALYNHNKLVHLKAKVLRGPPPPPPLTLQNQEPATTIP